MDHKLHSLSVPALDQIAVSQHHHSMESVSVLHFLLEEQSHQLQLLYSSFDKSVHTENQAILMKNRIDTTVNTVTEEAIAIFPSRPRNPFNLISYGRKFHA